MGTLPSCINKDNTIFGGSFDLNKSKSSCKLLLLCKGVEDPLLEISILI